MSTPVCWDDIDALLWALDPGQVAYIDGSPYEGAWDWTVCGNANCVTDEECTGVVSCEGGYAIVRSHGAAFSTDDTTRIGWFDTADPDGTFAHLGNGNGGVPDSGELAYIESVLGESDSFGCECGPSACTQFWTNHMDQYEIEP